MTTSMYSKNAHYKWGWNGEWHNDPIVGGRFQTSIGSCVNGHKPFRDECVIAAGELANQFTKPLLVGFSGGSDSQVACLAFKEAGVPFTPLIIKLLGPKGGLRNEHDISAAFEFCKRFGLTPRVETLDLQRFYQTRGLELAAEHCFTNVEFLIQLAMVERFQSTHAYVAAGGDLLISKRRPLTLDPTTELITVLPPTPLQQHLIKYDIEGNVKFFMYSPELIAAYLNNDIVKGYIAAHESLYAAFYETYKKRYTAWQCFNYYVKPLFYQLQWPEIISRKKYTGFEKADDLLEEGKGLINAEVAKYEPLRSSCLVPVQELLQHLTTSHGSSKVWTS